ncbi:MAG: hypothetical protein ACI9FJ_001832, partial [Alteromonadaceae bacterium]
LDPALNYWRWQQQVKPIDEWSVAGNKGAGLF